ncbi:hypothetical protein YC2023_024745 [Brassica napus]
MRRFLEGVELRSVVVCSDCSLVGEHSLDLCLGRPPVVLHKEDACRSSWSARVEFVSLSLAPPVTVSSISLLVVKPGVANRQEWVPFVSTCFKLGFTLGCWR